MWRPIETAPRDGTVMLLVADYCNGREPFVGWYSTDKSDDGWTPMGPYVWKRYNAASVAENIVKWWMPVPELPEEAA